jgi:predicted ATPase with chaperone activity
LSPIHNPNDIDSAFEAIDSDVLAVRDRALARAAGMLETIDAELARLEVLQDCALTLKSANDSAMTMLRRAVDETSRTLRSARLAAEVDHQVSGGRVGGKH